MPPGDSNGRPDAVRTTVTMFEIIEAIKEEKTATITGLASELGYAKSTVYRHLKTLGELGYVVEDEEGYRVGLRFLDLGQQARRNHRGYSLAREKVEELAETTGERVQFIVEEHGEAVYLHRASGEHAVHTDSGIGSRIPLYATATGKAILAAMNDTDRFEMIERVRLAPITESTITERERLLEELETIRNRGYSYNRQENLEGLNAVAVPVTGPDGDVLGALGVSGPTHRLTGDWFEDELPSLLLGAANELELNIAHT